jgi:hypothetical protein
MSWITTIFLWAQLAAAAIAALVLRDYQDDRRNSHDRAAP